MSLTTVKYSCTSFLSCAKSLPASVIICVDSDLVVPINGVAVSTIEGQVTQYSECPKSFNCVLYTYTLYYETDQLVDGKALETSDIEGVFCEGCLTQWVKDYVDSSIAPLLES